MIPRRVCFSAPILILCTFCLHCAWSAAAPPVEGEKSSRDTAAQAILDSRLPEVRLDQTGFNDAIQFLRDVTSANITVNWKAVESAGIPENAPVSARLRDVKLSTALTTILQNV